MVVPACRYNFSIGKASRRGQLYLASTPAVHVPKVLALTPKLVEDIVAAGFLGMLVGG